VVRPVLASAAVVALTLPLAAQPGRGSMGGGFRDRPGVAPPSGFRILQAPAGYRPPGLARAQPYGFYPTYGFGGGFITGGYAPYYVVPPPVFLADPAPVGGGPVAPAGPSTVTAVSGVLPATLVLQYPAAARVWVDGVEVKGDPDEEWTLTSRPLRPGETATFKVRGRWEQGGRTYEAVREVPLGPGARSRLLVVSGTEVKD
jgi:uncharacterized protein (TIGR03000 family)